MIFIKKMNARRREVRRIFGLRMMIIRREKSAEEREQIKYNKNREANLATIYFVVDFIEQTNFHNFSEMIFCLSEVNHTYANKSRLSGRVATRLNSTVTDATQ